MNFTKRFCRTLLISLMLAFPAMVSAQLQVTPNTNANALAQSLVGTGVVVSNATLQANGSLQAGFFDGSSSNIGINSGILLTSGSVNIAVGPNTGGGSGLGAGGPGYPLLTQIAGVPTFDRCVLQFDVVPYADTLTFRYVFASEEYPEYVCATVNDAFGFFISGPNPTGGSYVDANVALIPGTNIGVSINSVNPGVVGGSGSAGNCISLGYSQFYVSNTGGATVEYDGFTRSLVAKLVVVPCSTYTFKLAIADGGDGIFDSGVFLEEGSLSATGNSVDSRTVAGTAYTSIIEGCLDGEIVIRRDGTGNGQPQTVDITIGGTATNGVDYTNIPNQVTIPAGQDSIILSIHAFQDGLAENFESLIIYLMSPCQGQVLDSTLIYIEDSLNIQILPGDTSICIGESVLLTAIGGGNFQWSPPAGLNTTGIFNPTATPTATTTYTVSSSILSCTSTKEITINVKDYPNINMSPDTAICIGSNTQLNANISPAASLQWSPPTGLSSTTVSNPFANPSTTTTYTLTATNGQNCSTHDSVTVTVNSFPQANAGPDVAFCTGDSVQLQATGGVSYNWSPGTGLSDKFVANPIAKPSSTTNYSVMVTDANGCSAGDVVEVTVNQTPTIDAGADKNICEGSSTQLQVIGAAGYQWSPAGSLDNPTLANPTATPSQTTTYTVVGTAANGCTGEDQVEVAINPLPATTVQASPNIVCPGEDIQVQAGGGIAYQWTPASGLSNPNIDNPVATVTQDVTYTVKVTDVEGCESFDSILLQVHDLPTIQTSGNDTICFGESVTLSASGGATYNWSPAASLSNPNASNPVASPNSTTEYTLQVTDANGCQNTDQLSVSVMPLPAANAGADKSACEGDIVNLSATGGVEFNWIPTGGLSCSNCPDPSWVASSTRSFTVTAFSDFGCVDKDTVEVNVTPAPTTSVVASAPGTCPGGSVQLTASGGDGYTWQTGIPGLSSYSTPNPTATPPSTTEYFVTVQDNSTGCTALDSVTVQVYPLPNVQVSANDTLCLGDSKVLQASGAKNYSWSPSASLSSGNGKNVTASPTSTTIYTVTGTDNKGCVNTAQVEVKVNPLPTANAGQDQQGCKGTVLQLNGSGGASYTWSPSSGLSCTNCANPALVATSTRNYVLKVTDVNGCIDRDTIAIDVLPLPPVQAGPDVTLCPNGTTTLQASGAKDYTWSPGTGLSSTTVSNPTAAPSSAITYTVTGVDGNNCVNKDSVRVDFYPFTPVTAGPDASICNGESTQLQGQNAAQYTWSPAASLSDSNVSNPTATPTTTTTYTLNAADANGCTSSDLVRVTVRPLPNIVLTQGDTTLCVDKSVQLGATGGISYDWTPPTGLSDPTIADPIANPTNSTEYTLTVVNVENCSAEETVRVDRYPVTDPNAQPAVTAICPGESVQLNSENGVTYAWIPALGLSNSTAADPLATPDSSTVYTLTIEDINGCIFTDEVDITVHPTPIADAGRDGSVFIGDSYQLQGSGNGDFTWTPDRWIDFPFSSNPVATPDSSIWYTLTVETPKGCVASDSVYVRVYYETKVHMPNAFSPNGDGQNDVFGPKWYNEFELVEFKVFNRWGVLMYSSDNANAGWDGTVDGEPQPVGTYIYIVRGVGNRGEPFFKQGNVTLLR